MVAGARRSKYGVVADASRRKQAGPREVPEFAQSAEADLRVVAIAVHEDAELLGAG